MRWERQAVDTPGPLAEAREKHADGWIAWARTPGHDISGTFVIERLREVRIPDTAVDQPPHRRWQRLPLFLHVRALRP